jgi:hypothetical protein
VELVLAELACTAAVRSAAEEEPVVVVAAAAVAATIDLDHAIFEKK